MSALNKLIRSIFYRPSINLIDVDARKARFHDLVLKEGGAFSFEEFLNANSGYRGHYLLELLQKFPEIFKAVKKEMSSGKKTINSQDFIDDIVCGVEEMYIGYVENTTFNAVAICHEYEEYIGINIGLPLKFCLYFNTLMSTRDFLHFVGDSEFEKFTLEEVRQELISTYTLDATGKIPVSPARAELAYLFFHFSTLFAFYHEMVHHLGGHVGYSKSAYGLNAYTEFDNSLEENKREFCKDCQALELEADTLAMVLMYADVVKFYNMKKKAGKFGVIDILKKSKINSTDFLVLVVIFVFHVFQDQANINFENKYSRHPNTAVRRLNAIWSLSKIQAANNEGTEEERTLRYGGLSKSYEEKAHIISRFEPSKISDSSFEEMHQLQKRVFTGPLREGLNQSIMKRIKHFSKT